jgi:hypothetical protein
MSGAVAPVWRPGTAVILDFDLGMIAWVDSDAYGECAAWQARAAVEYGIGGELGGAQDHLVYHWAATQ